MHDNNCVGTQSEGHRCSSTEICRLGSAWGERLCLFSVKCSNILLQPEEARRVRFGCRMERGRMDQGALADIFEFVFTCKPEIVHPHQRRLPCCCVCMLKYSNKNVMKIWTVMFIDCEIWYTLEGSGVQGGQLSKGVHTPCTHIALAFNLLVQSHWQSTPPSDGKSV